MPPRVCLIIASDPRASGRPGEAIRLAAGLSAGQRVDLTVYLHGPAIRTLSESVDGLVDEENFDQYWPILRESGLPVWVPRQAVELTDLGPPRSPFQEASPSQLTQLLRASTYVLRF
jgi:hypothetical protein